MLVCGDSLDPARRNGREPVAMDEALQMVSEPTLAVIRACAGQGANMWDMCRHWTHRRVPRRNVSVADEDVGSFEWGCM